MTGNDFSTIDAGVASDNIANANAAALQRLIDDVQAAGGGTITIPSGIYVIDGTISLNPPVGLSIALDGGEGATLAQTAGTEVPPFGVGAEDQDCDAVIADLQIQGEWAARAT